MKVSDRPLRLLLAPWLLVLAAGTASAQSADIGRITHLLSRATYGVRPEDLSHVQQVGAARWLDEQLHPERINDSALEAKLDRLETLRMSVPELAQSFPIGQRRDSTMQPRQTPRRILIELVTARMLRAAQSERQLEAVMTDFWFNHFNVFWGKGPLRYLVADYENSAIRPYVFGHFYDMLEATAQHPAMLIYLDNAQSNARRGVNENYARELMELHTLGVDGGYTQQDVQEVARAFTGWTVQRPDVRFRFARGLHDDGAKTILGKRLRAGRGIEDGEDVLRLLARSRATAQHIARELIERFVNDQPSQAFVDELAAVFLKTDGDLRAVTRALFTSRHFYETGNVRTKVKTPFELVASALRVTDTENLPGMQALQTLRSLGELPYTESQPTGFPARSDDWVNSGAMLARMNFGTALAGRIARQSRLGNSVDEMLSRVLPGVDTSKRRAQIERDAANDPVKALGLALGSPEFQVK